MNLYTNALLAVAIIISIPSLFLIIVGVYNSSWENIVFWGSMLLLWWTSYVNVKKGGKGAFGGSFLLVILFWLLLLGQTVMRIIFVIQNGGMDRADGYGSPGAFLIGLVGEQLVFIPLTVAAYFGVRHLVKYKSIKTGKTC